MVTAPRRPRRPPVGVFTVTVEFHTSHPLTQDEGQRLWRFASNLRRIGANSYRLTCTAPLTGSHTLGDPNLLTALLMDRVQTEITTTVTGWGRASVIREAETP